LPQREPSLRRRRSLALAKESHEMATYPTSPRADFIQWCQAHSQVFIDNAAAIGLDPAQATAFAANTRG